MRPATPVAVPHHVVMWLTVMILAMGASQDAPALREETNNFTPPVEEIMLQGNVVPSSMPRISPVEATGKANLKLLRDGAAKAVPEKWPGTGLVEASTEFKVIPGRSQTEMDAAEAAQVALNSALAATGFEKLTQKRLPRTAPVEAPPVVQLVTPPKNDDKVTYLRRRLHDLEARLNRLGQSKTFTVAPSKAAQKKALAPAALPNKPTDIGPSEAEAMVWAPVGDGVREAEAQLGNKAALLILRKTIFHLLPCKFILTDLPPSLSLSLFR